MAERVVFYRLTHKFVSKQDDVPEGACRVVYYSLAIGHHVGVLDCFQTLVDIPLEDYRRWVASVSAGPARRKLESLLRWGEIEINHSQAGDLLPTLDGIPAATNGGQASWSGMLARGLQEMIEEPALYMMARKLA